MNSCQRIEHIRFFLIGYIVLNLGVFTLSTSMAMQNELQLEQPPLVRLTGVFSRLDEPHPGGLSTLQVSIKDTKWTFAVKKFEKLTGAATTHLRLLQSLFPPQLRLTGSPALIEPLQQPTILGKPFVIEGRFYSADRMLLVLSVIESRQEQQ